MTIHGRSRYPAYADSLDDIIGVAHAKDIFAALRPRPGQTIRAVLRPPLFVPGTRKVEDVLADMKRLKTHLAVVLDEYGGRAADGGLRLDGSMAISDFNAEYGTSLDDTDYTTIGGYIFGQLGRLPRVSERVSMGRFTLEVIEMDGGE